MSLAFEMSQVKLPGAEGRMKWFQTEVEHALRPGAHRCWEKYRCGGDEKNG